MNNEAAMLLTSSGEIFDKIAYKVNNFGLLPFLSAYELLSFLYSPWMGICLTGWLALSVFLCIDAKKRWCSTGT